MAKATRSDPEETRPRIDVVLQATGRHAHAASHGIVEALRRIGHLGRVFQPTASWGAAEPTFDDGLFEYLASPNAEFILFLGFDWHSQSLHSTTRWKYRIRSSPCVKVGYFHETLSNGTEQERQQKRQAVLSCTSLLDMIWHASPRESAYLSDLIGGLRPVDASPFAVDTAFFRPLDENLRGRFAFFRGKTQPFTEPSQYQERRDLIAHLQQFGLIDVKTYDPAGFSDQQLVEEYSSYSVCIDPPSVFDGPTTRVYEAISCGCIVFSHARNFTVEEVDNLAPFLRVFRTNEELATALITLRHQRRSQLYEPDQLERVRKQISLDGQVSGLLLKWVERLKSVHLDAPVVRIYDHPYHALTKSQDFIFKTFNDVNVVTIANDEAASVSSIVRSPTYRLGAFSEIAWQTIHIYPQFNRAPPDRRHFFPMFDGSNHRTDQEFPTSGSYHSFSSTLDRRLRALGLTTEYLRYFPKMARDATSLSASIERTRMRQQTRTLRMYFWHRTNEIGLGTALELCAQLGCDHLTINTHCDPGADPIGGLPDVLNGIQIRTHGWLEDKRDLDSLLDDSDVYLAPRSCEGIGLSFLDAMARSICVIAYNAPTMNEYLIHGQTGIIFDDIRKPRLVGTLDVAKIRENTLLIGSKWAAEWIEQYAKLVESIHPIKSSPALNFLRSRGVSFHRRFAFGV